MKHFLFALIAITGIPQVPSSVWKPPKEPVYVVMTNRSSEGSGADDTKFGDLLLIQIIPNVDAPQKPDYEIGKSIPFFVDGHRQGTVRIEKLKNHSCEGAAAVVVPSESSIRDLAGLATGIDGIKDHPSSRREATASERNEIVKLAIREFLRNSVQSSLMTRVNVGSLLAVRTDDSSESTVIGSFFIQTKSERHDVFLIARNGQTGMSLEYSEYSRSEDLEDFKDRVSIGFVDHLDLDGDRSDEIVLRIRGYESEGYEVLTRNARQWLVAATGGQSGC